MAEEKEQPENGESRKETSPEEPQAEVSSEDQAVKEPAAQEAEKETEPEEEEASFSEDELSALLGDEEEEEKESEIKEPGEEIIPEVPGEQPEKKVEPEEEEVPLEEEKAEADEEELPKPEPEAEETLQPPEPEEKEKPEPEEEGEDLAQEEVVEVPAEKVPEQWPVEEEVVEQEELPVLEEEGGDEMVALLEEEEEEGSFLPVLEADQRWKRLKPAAVILGVLFLVGGLSWWITSGYLDKKGMSEAEKHFIKGIEFVKGNKFNRAEDEFEQGIKLAPENVEAYNRFGKAYLSVENYRMTLSSSEGALKLDPDNIAARQLMVKAFLAQGDLSKAKEICREVLSLDEKNTETLLDLASVFQQMGWQENALSTLKGMLSIDPKNNMALNMLQKVYMEKSQYDQAFGVHRYIMQLGGRLVNIDLLNRLAYIYIEKKDWARAEEIAADVLAQEPESVKARYNLARVMKDMPDGDMGRALEELKFILDNDPNYAKAYNLSGEIYNQIDMHKQAYTQFKKALELDPEDGEANYNMAGLYYKAMDNMPKALIYYEAAKRLGIESPKLNFNLGVTYYKSGNYQKSLEAWENLDDAGDPVLSFNKGNAMLQLNQWREAGVHFQQTIDQNMKQLESETLPKGAVEAEALYQDLSMAYNNLGLIQEKLKQEKEAMKTYTKAIEAASWGERQNQKAQGNLNRIIQQKPMSSLSQAMFSEVKKENPNIRGIRE